MLMAPCWAKNEIEPVGPSFARLRFGETRPGSALLAEVKGRGVPVGHTVRNDLAEASSSIVMLINAAVALAGNGAEARFGAGVVNGRSISWPPRSGPAAQTPTASERRRRAAGLDMDPPPWDPSQTRRRPVGHRSAPTGRPPCPTAGRYPPPERLMHEFDDRERSCSLSAESSVVDATHEMVPTISTVQ